MLSVKRLYSRNLVKTLKCREENMERINLILDTDIGPDCDDAGALGLLHLLAKRVDMKILAMTHCTSSPYGCGCIDAINRAYGHTEIPVGTLETDGFLVGDDYEKYNKYICQNYKNSYKSKESLRSALEILKAALRSADDNSVTFVSIGPLPNLANLIEDKEGFQLVKSKVKLLVSMGGGQSDAEWNILMDIKSAKTVCERWPSPIWFSPYETGVSIITGRSWGAMSENHPVRKAYDLHSPGGRMSWDLTAVWAAVMGCEPYFKLSEKGNVVVTDEGITIFTQDSQGRFQYVLNKIGPEEIGRQIDNMWSD
jgi:hypothetical protein